MMNIGRATGIGILMIAMAFGTPFALRYVPLITGLITMLGIFPLVYLAKQVKA